MKEFWRQPLVWGVTGILALGLVIAGALILFRPQSPVPGDISKKLDFSVLYPNKTSEYTVDPKSFYYDPSSKVLIFHVRNAANDLTMSEQTTPDPINDIPEYYGKMTEKLNDYRDFDSINGKVSLTRPTELKGGQTAVFNGKGTFIFVHPAHDLSEDDWRKFFNSLVVETH